MFKTKNIKIEEDIDQYRKTILENIDSIKRLKKQVESLSNIYDKLDNESDSKIALGKSIKEIKEEIEKLTINTKTVFRLYKESAIRNLENEIR